MACRSKMGLFKKKFFFERLERAPHPQLRRSWTRSQIPSPLLPSHTEQLTPNYRSLGFLIRSTGLKLSSWEPAVSIRHLPAQAGV